MIYTFEKKEKLLLGLYIVLTLTGVFFHEPWGDELQAWQLSLYSENFTDLFKNTQNESHALSWYLILTFLQNFGSNPRSMQLFHVMIAWINAFLIVKYSPFSFKIKALLISGYLFLFEYTILSRNYALGIVFLLLFIIEYSKENKSWWLLSLYIFVALNTNFYAFIVVNSLVVLVLLEQKKETKFYFLATYILGVILLYLQISPAESGNSILKLDFDFKKIAQTASIFTKLVFPLPKFQTDSWMQYLLVDVYKPIFTLFTTAFSFSILGIILFSFQKKINYLVVIILVIFQVLFFNYFVYHAFMRHFGHIFIVFLLIFWVSISKGFIINQFSKVVIITVLLIHILTGIIYLSMDLFLPFSSIKSMNKYLISNNLTNNKIIIYPEVKTFGTNALLDKKVWSLDSKKEIGFGNHKLAFDEKNGEILTENVLDSLLNSTEKPLTIITYQEVKKHQKNCVQKFEKSMVFNEHYYVYWFE